MSRSKSIFLVLLALLVTQSAQAGTIGHYYPGVMGMRDIILPPKGLYALYYNPIYYSDDLKNANGNSHNNYSMSAAETKHVSVYGHDLPVRLSASLTADVDASMFFTTEQLLLIWVPGWKLLGADYGLTIAPSMGYVSIDARITAHATGTVTIGDISKTVTRDGTVKISSDDYGFGDILVMPVMLDWRGKNYDLGLYYGFFAPTG